MPKVPFQYYMIGFRDYMKSGNFKSTWASSSASCFLGLTLEKLERHPDHILAIMLELLPTIEYVANNQTKFEATERIYGNFPEIFKRIQTLHSALGG
jgi:hypothetical protein